MLLSPFELDVFDGVFFVEDRPTLCPVGLRGADTCKAVDHRCCRGLSFRVSNSGVGAGIPAEGKVAKRPPKAKRPSVSQIAQQKAP